MNPIIKIVALGFVGISGLGFSKVGYCQDVFKSVVRPTDPQSPATELAGFQVPGGFKVQLVASEPDIFKPMNLAFDGLGRLWVTCSQEYPFAAEEGKGRDAVKILEDTNGDGKADVIKTFADGLNIPIGVLPYGNGAIVYSIPNIWYFEDTDGDDRADRRTKLYGPMGYERDTHGMNNAFRMGFDGWVYACHGFNNDTSVEGRDGHRVTMNSGNTYRFRPDGSRIEQFTWGQVNPFGMDIDQWGMLFTADCHTKPIYALLRGGYYPSFGKPHDGLGFVPSLMNHLHGSTAIAGVTLYSGSLFPVQYKDTFFGGNVMTSRINRNRIERTGATIRAIAEPDFLSAKDPWFRPVDVREGPDGALYIADFYNRIIGHYEVDLNHPGRDRKLGRIWRVVYENKNQESGSRFAKLADIETTKLVQSMDEANRPALHLVTQELHRRYSKKTADLVSRLWSNMSDESRSHLLWLIERHEPHSDEFLLKRLEEEGPIVRTHVLKIMSERKQLSAKLYQNAITALEDESPHVQLAAVDTIGQHPSFASVKGLKNALSKVETGDAFLKHALRLAYRNQLKNEAVAKRINSQVKTLSDRKELASLYLSVQNSAAASFLLELVAETELPPQELIPYIQHAAQFSSDAEVERLAKLVEERFKADLPMQVNVFGSLDRGSRARGAKSEHLKTWAYRLATQILDDEDRLWTNHPVAGKNPQNPWAVENRRCADGATARFFSTIPVGEKATGVLHSPPFAAPMRLSFYLAGHLGNPQRKYNPRNTVRLRDVETGEIVKEVRPPRNDIAQIVDWDLSDVKDRKVRLEIEDSDDRPAYAWIAIGRFSLDSLKVPTRSPQERAVLQVAAATMLRHYPDGRLRKKLESLLADKTTGRQVRAAAAQAIAVQRAMPLVEPIATLISDAAVPTSLREQVVAVFSEEDSKLRRAAVASLLAMSPDAIQVKLAASLSNSAEGLLVVLETAEKGRFPVRWVAHPVMQDRFANLTDDSVRTRVKTLIKDLPKLSVERQKIIDQRVVAYRGMAKVAGEDGVRRGRALFEKNCSACHQLKGKGKMIGPQLDGIGKRGMVRLFEDMLDPNRNVDVAFRTTSIVTAKGKIITGLVRREEGQVLVLANEKGEEIRIDKSSIDRSKRTTTSLMPDDIALKLKPQELNDLVRFLLSQ